MRTLSLACCVFPPFIFAHYAKSPFLLSCTLPVTVVPYSQAGVVNGPCCFNWFLTVYEWESNCELNEQVWLGNYCNLTPPPPPTHPPLPHTLPPHHPSRLRPPPPPPQPTAIVRTYTRTHADLDHTKPKRNLGPAGVCRSRRTRPEGEKEKLQRKTKETEDREI